MELPVEQTAEPELKSRPSYTVWLIVGLAGTIIFLLVVVAVIGIGIIVTSRNKPPVPVTPPPVVVEPTVPQATPSAFATDSGLLKIRADLLDLRTQIDAIDYFEPQIAPPTIDLNINIPYNRN